VVVVFKSGFRGIELAETLDIYLSIIIDQNIGDGRVLQKRFERPQAEHLVLDFGEKQLPFILIERYAPFVLEEHLLYEPSYLRLEHIRIECVQQRQVHKVQQAVVYPGLEFVILIRDLGPYSPFPGQGPLSMNERFRLRCRGL
jgi:hypothetical protein